MFAKVGEAKPKPPAQPVKTVLPSGLGEVIPQYQCMQDPVSSGMRNSGSLDHFFERQRFGNRAEAIEQFDGFGDDRNPVLIDLARNFLSLWFGFNGSSLQYFGGNTSTKFAYLEKSSIGNFTWCSKTAIKTSACCS
jgi:hypothetical protein